MKNITRCSFTDTEKYMYCFADGETNALGLKEMKKALSQMKQGHDIYSIGLETLRDPKYEFHSRERFLKLRSATEKELLDLETLKDKIITPELDNARKRNIERIGNLTEKVNEEMKEHGVGIIQQKIGCAIRTKRSFVSRFTQGLPSLFSSPPTQHFHFTR